MNSLTTTFVYEDKVVSWQVPATGVYDIQVYGAQGGAGSGGPGGTGAEIGGDVSLQAGEVLSILVGSKGGTSASPGSGGPGSGGGGSFVVGPAGEPLMIAGGGGGAGGFANGGDGAIGTSGQDGFFTSGVPGGVGGTNGSGGAAGIDDGAAGGGGLLGDGGNNFATGGAAFIHGGSGGVAAYRTGPSGMDGGFGGGGGLSSAGGGGGGFSGGGGGGGIGSAGASGGGGGSYNASTESNADLIAKDALNPDGSGNGLVMITPVPVLVPPTIRTDPLPISVDEGTTASLYQALVDNVQDTSTDAHISITSLGLSNTMGFAYLPKDEKLLTYTADGYQPGATQPQDNFTYTAVDQYGQQVTGTVAVTVTGANETTQVGTARNDTLTAFKANTRLIGGGGDDTLNANAAGTTVFGGQGDDTINVNAAKAVVHGGTGTNTINLGNTAQDTIVLQQGGTDQISGFNLRNDVLDLSQVLAEAQASYSASEFQVTDSGNNATLSWGSSPSFGGGALAVLNGVGPGVTLQTLIADGALKTS